MRRLYVLAAMLLSITMAFVFGAAGAQAAPVTKVYCSSSSKFQACVGWNYTYPHAFGLYWNNNKYGFRGHITLSTLRNRHWSVDRALLLNGHSQEKLEKWGVAREEICADVGTTAINFVVICHKF